MIILELINGELALLYNGSDAYAEKSEEFCIVKANMRIIMKDMMLKSSSESKKEFVKG